MTSKDLIQENTIEEQKQRLEVEKLRAEIKTISMPFYTRSRFWLSMLAALAAFGAIITGFVTGYFDNQKLLNEIRSENLKQQTRLLEKQTEELTFKKMNLIAQIECYELSQIVNLSFLNAIQKHPSRKSKVETSSEDLKSKFVNIEGVGDIETEENITLISQALSAGESFRNMCDEVVNVSKSNYKEKANEIYVTAISSVPMLESKKVAKIQGIMSLKGFEKLAQLGIEGSAEYIREEWVASPYETWEERMFPIRSVASRKGGFLNTYLDSYFLDEEYTNLIKELFWPKDRTSKSTELNAGSASNIMEKLKTAKENKATNQN